MFLSNDVYRILFIWRGPAEISLPLMTRNKCYCHGNIRDSFKKLNVFHLAKLWRNSWNTHKESYYVFLQENWRKLWHFHNKYRIQIYNCYCHSDRPHLTLLCCVFLRESRVASSASSGSRLPVLELPVHWPAVMSRRQLKNDDRCPQNNLILLYTKRKRILYQLALISQPWYCK
jgi:hypothetical protein